LIGLNSIVPLLDPILLLRIFIRVDLPDPLLPISPIVSYQLITQLTYFIALIIFQNFILKYFLPKFFIYINF
jgi:hypothetical protein